MKVNLVDAMVLKELLAQRYKATGQDQVFQNIAGENWELTSEEIKAAFESVVCLHPQNGKPCAECMVPTLFYVQIKKIGMLMGLTTADATKIAMEYRDQRFQKAGGQGA